MPKAVIAKAKKACKKSSGCTCQCVGIVDWVIAAIRTRQMPNIPILASVGRTDRCATHIVREANMNGADSMNGSVGYFLIMENVPICKTNTRPIMMGMLFETGSK